MYEIICPTAKEQKSFIECIRNAVAHCPNDGDLISGDCEEKKLEEARKAKARMLLNSLYEKDFRIAQYCEEKMKVFAEIMVS